MNQEQFQQIRTGVGFFAALDQSGGSTPGALAQYGVNKDAYSNEDEMMALIHEMRSRIIESPSFNGERVIGAILFEATLDRQIAGQPSVEYLWGVKHVVPFLKVDRGLAEVDHGVQLMRPIPDLANLLERGLDNGVFGTKMRSFVQLADKDGIHAIADQQFAVAAQILDAGLIPILEPEIDIHSPEKADAEELLKAAILDRLSGLGTGQMVILKLSLPNTADFYADLLSHPSVLRVVALSGGYTQAQAVDLLRQNHGVIASFSRALAEGLSATQTDEEFDDTLAASIERIYQASLT